MSATALSGMVGVFDVSTPTSPQSMGAVDSGLSGGVGAVAVRGTLVVAGEWTSNAGARVALLDASHNPPTVVSTATTHFTGNTTNIGDNPQSLAAINSIAFLSDTRVLATSATGNQLCLIDFTNRASPTLTYKNTIFAGIGAADGDADAQRIVAADGSGGQFQLYDATGATIGSPQNTVLGGVNSISLSAPLAVGGSNNNFQADLVDFSVPNATAFQAQVAGGATAAMHGSFIALGSLEGPFGSSLGRVQFFDASNLSTPLGHADVDLASVSTISIGQTVDVRVSPSSVDFGVVAVAGVTTQTITVKNTGSVARQVSAIVVTALTGGAFVVKTPPTLAVPFSVAAGGGTTTITVQFTGGAALGNASATLTLTTSDPAAASIPISLIGKVGAPAAAFSVSSLAFGNVAGCTFKDLTVTLLNNGSLPLTVTGVTFGGEPRLSLTTPLPLTVPAGMSAPLTVRFTPNNALGAIAAGIQFALTSNDPNASKLTITGTAVASPPSLEFSPTTLVFGTIPVNSVGALSLNISNVSQCNPLTAILSTTAPFSVEVDPSMGFIYTGTLSRMVTLPPGGTASFAVAFAPTTAGPFASIVTITCNDPSHATVNIPLNGAAAVAPPSALELILDQSGSMRDPVTGGTKMTSLHQTVELFANLIPLNNNDECGAVRFDSQAALLIPRALWDSAQQAALTTAVNALQPATSTSIGAGLQTGLTDLSGSTLPRRVMLVFTDGMENTPPMIATVLPSVAQANIEVYAVGLGRPTDISTAALSALAVSSNGKFFSTDDALVLRKQFLQVLADAFRQNVAADPIVIISANTKASLAVNLNSCDRAATFAASWDHSSSSLQVRLIAPNGMVFTPSSTATNRLVEYGQGATYAWYRVRFAPLDPASGKFLNPAPAGKWTLEVTPAGLAGPTERVAISVLVDSKMTIQPVIRGSDAASPMYIGAALFDGGKPVIGAKVVAKVTPPATSLAAAMTPAVVAQALGADKHIRPLRPGKTGKSRKVALTYARETGHYSARLPAPKVDGLYQIEILASGPACSGQFNRYVTQTVYIAPKARGSGTKVIVTPVGVGGGVIVVTPVNASNQPLGTGFGHLIDLTVDDKESSVSPIIDLGNGQYAYRAWWNPRAESPSATVSVAGTKKTFPLVATKRPGR